MLFSELDYLANRRKSLLTDIPAGVKVSILVLSIIFSLLTRKPCYLLISYFSFILLILFFKLPIKKTFLPSLFPLFFITAFFLSFRGFSLYIFSLYALKALNLSLLLILILASTPMFKLLKFLTHFLPTFLISSLWLTYKSLFILDKNFESLLNLWHLRGGVSLTTPILALKNIAYGLGFLIIKSLDDAEREYQALILRGYDGKIFF